MGDQFQQLGHFGLEGEGLLAHTDVEVFENRGPAQESATGQDELWARRPLFKPASGFYGWFYHSRLLGGVSNWAYPSTAYKSYKEGVNTVRQAVQKVLAGFFCGVLPCFVWAQPIVDHSHVQEAIKRGVQVWDVRDARDYAKGHLPGAVTIGDAAAALRDGNSEDFLATARIESILGAAGIDPLRETVVYGSRGSWNPYFGRYALRYFGGSKVSVFHDGIEGWQAAGLPVSTSAVQATPVRLKLSSNPALAVSTPEMISRLNHSNVQLVDVRTPKEFAGEDIRALRGGHIPGAVNIPYEQNWTDPETLQKLARKQVGDSRGMVLKSNLDLKALYAKLDPEKETVVYCQSGARASETAGVLEQLGFKNVRVYDSSWLGYGNQMDAPANNVTIFNVGALNARMGTMLARIDSLEKELAAAKK